MMIVFIHGIPCQPLRRVFVYAMACHCWADAALVDVLADAMAVCHHPWPPSGPVHWEIAGVVPAVVAATLAAAVQADLED